jgi:hypothetical protein
MMAFRFEGAQAVWYINIRGGQSGCRSFRKSPTAVMKVSEVIV